MKTLCNIILAIVFLIPTSFVYAQTKNAPFYHVVKQGETVYSISKNYGIRIDSLLSNNKKIVNYHIAIGDTLVIPLYKNVYDFIEYRTEKRESLVDIANHFQVSLNELKRRNPHLGNNVAKNEVVFIPIQKKTPNTLAEQTTPSTPTQTSTETISVPDLPQSKKSDCIAGNLDTKKKYTVALILPFSADKLTTALSSAMKKKARQKEPSAVKYLSFYQGVTLALDTLAERGLNICLNVYDVSNGEEMNRLLEKSEMRITDLIIGIIYADAFKKVADFAAQYDIPVINIASSRNDILQGYPNVAKIVPDDIAVGFATQKIVREDNSNILIVRRNPDVYNRSVEKLKTLYPKYREFLSEGKGMASALSLLDASKPNYVFMFSENTTGILDIMRVFDEKKKQYDITLVGYPNWNNIGELDYRYAHNLKLHFIVHQVVDYNEQKVKNFVTMFRNRFNSEPNMSAFQGYDIAYNFIDALSLFGSDCLECFNHIPHHFLSTGDIIFNNTPGNGYNNQYWNVYTVKEYEIVRMP